MKSHLLYLGFCIFLAASSLFAEELKCNETEKKTLTEKLQNATKAKNCPEAVNTFRTLYLCLQQQLDADGHKTVIDKKGKATGSEATAAAGDSNGKKFQDALYKEFKNSLIKVAALYQEVKKGQPAEAPAATDQKGRDIINLLKVIDPSLEQVKSDAQINFKKFFENLKIKSDEKFKDKPNLKLTSDDMYLLEKLLIHSQDRICLIAHLEKTGKGNKIFSPEYLTEVRNSPLNKLVQALKDSNTPEKTLIEPEKLSSDDEAIKLAVANAINNLKAFYQKNKKCLATAMKQDKNRNSIQNNIQVCNYNKFLDALGDAEEKNIEAILHFINANEQLKKDGKALHPDATIAADTGLQTLDVAAIVKSIVPPTPVVKPEEKKITCTGDAPPYTVANLKKANDGSVDKNQFKCTTTDNKEIIGSDCYDKLIKVEGDKVSKNPEVATLASLSIDGTEDPKCKDMFKTATPPPPPPVTPESDDVCKAKPDSQECCTKQNNDWLNEHQEASRSAIHFKITDNKCQAVPDKAETKDSDATPDGGAKPADAELPELKTGTAPAIPHINAQPQAPRFFQGTM